MIEYRDGTFSAPTPFTDEVMKKFKDEVEDKEAIALHVGTLEELNKKIKQKLMGQQEKYGDNPAPADYDRDEAPRED